MGICLCNGLVSGRGQAITCTCTWTNVDQDIWHHMASVDHSELMHTTVKSLIYSVLPKGFWAPVLRTSGSWNLPVRMEGSLVRNFNNYYVLLIHVFDGCSNRFDPCDHFNLVCCCLSPALISDKRSIKDIAKSQTHMIGCWNARTAYLKNQSVLQRCLSNFWAIGRLEEA